MAKLVSATSVIEVSTPTPAASESLWITQDELCDATGWRLRPEGLCQGSVCVPLGPEVTEKAVDGEQVDAASVWRSLGRPVLHDASHSTWMLGEAAEDRARQLASLEAPDFTLPDIEGKLHSLSDYRGQKVLLATWASW